MISIAIAKRSLFVVSLSVNGYFFDLSGYVKISLLKINIQKIM